MLEIIKDICLKLKINGGSAYLAGGCVRDKLLHIQPADYDIEVYGLSMAKIEEILNEYPLNKVGKSFGILKIKDLPIDISLPRIDKKVSEGHKGFEVITNPDMDMQEACKRRDFTINSMLYDPLENKLYDFYNGERDLRDKLLFPTSLAHFGEDPLRVMRAAVFIARFNMTPSRTLIDLCEKTTRGNLSRERIYEEFKKLILKGNRIGKALEFIQRVGWIKYFPELWELVGIKQDPKYHFGKDVWEHTCDVMDMFAKERTGDDWEDLIVGFACLCHDFGKVTTTVTQADGRITSHGHEAAGVVPTTRFIGRLVNHPQLVKEVLPLVEHHLKPTLLYSDKSSNAAIRRLAKRVNIERLCRVAKADKLGKSFNNKTPEVEWLLEKANSLGCTVERVKPVITGKHLIELGHSPGPLFSKVLDELYELQVEGSFSTEEEGIRILKEELLKEGKYAKNISSTIPVGAVDADRVRS